MNDLVSVIIPCYNAERYVENAVRSIMEQTYSNLEIIVINDGSIDSTKEILLNLSEKDERVIYYENKVNLKLVKTLNKALLLCKGDYIARMDADDICMPNRIFEQVSFFNNNPDVSVLGTSIQLFGEGVSEKIDCQPVNDEEIKSKIYVASPFHHPTVMFNMLKLKREDLFYDETYYRVEDYELWTRLTVLGYKFANIKEVLLKYRITSTSESKILKKMLK
ncbi:glycosyltransferase family 2 protein [Aquimarina agarivorans]|uniref:glycosyltransferase family 2 protein n=1 Tax=Aquimarina agarivorans TaxID=980584 RepID=UPI000248EB2D|nr:glycosyltransferase [Aquimarina agarivorans]